MLPVMLPVIVTISGQNFERFRIYEDAIALIDSAEVY